MKESIINSGITHIEQSSSSDLEKNKILIEKYKKFGKVYTSLIEKLSGKKIDENDLNFEEDRMQFIEFDHIIKDIQKKNQEKFEEMELDVKKLLLQNPSFKSQEKEALIRNEEGIELIKLNEGIFLVKIDNQIYNQLRDKNSQAFAYRTPGEISFIVIRHYPGEKYNSTNIDREKINVPHELHHIAWVNFYVQEKIGNEENPGMEENFAMFQDEVIAHLVSESRPFGYPLINLFNEEKKEEFEKDYPGKTEELREICWEINELFKEVTRAMNTRNIPMFTYIKPVMEAKTFTQLKNNIKEFQKLVLLQPDVITEEKEEENQYGWCSVEI